MSATQLKVVLVGVLLVPLLTPHASSQTTFWQQTNFPIFTNQEVTAMAARDSLVFAGGYGGFGLARSTDSGKHWAQSGNFQDLIGLCIHITHAGLVFVVNGSDRLLYRSEDNGNTWSPCPTGGLYFNPTIISDRSGTLFIGSSDGVRRSTDSGDSWTEENSGLVAGPNNPFTQLAINRNDVLVAATDSGVFKSTDHAESWVPLGCPRTDGFRPSVLGMNSLGYIFISGFTSSGAIDSLYRSTDNGKSWQVIIRGGTKFLYVDPTTDELVDASIQDRDLRNTGYLYSADNCETLSFYPIPFEFESFCYDGSSRYFIGTWNGVLTSSSLSSAWHSCNAGLLGASSEVSTMYCDQPGILLAGTRTFGLFRSTDNGNNFAGPTSSIPTSASVRQIAGTTNGTLIAAETSGLSRSTDGGVTWTPYSDFGALYDLGAVSVSTAGTIVLAGGARVYGGAEIDRSTDQGESWNEVSSIEPSPNKNSQSISVLSIGPAGTVLACTSYVFNPCSNCSSTVYGLIRSIDTGATWTPLSTNLPTVPNFTGLVWDSAGDAYASTSMGVLRSTDRGLTWEPASASLPTADIRCIVRNALDHLYIGTGGNGVFRSTDGGVSWSNPYTGLTDPTVNALAITADGYLFAGTEYGGIFRSVQSTTGVRSSVDASPTALVLRQNYPNPFNPTTRISFSLPKAENVSVIILDMLGRRVATLIDAKLATGEHSVAWNADGYSSGVYLCRVQAGGAVVVKKMVLVK